MPLRRRMSRSVATTYDPTYRPFTQTRIHWYAKHASATARHQKHKQNRRQNAGAKPVLGLGIHPRRDRHFDGPPLSKHAPRTARPGTGANRTWMFLSPITQCIGANTFPKATYVNPISRHSATEASWPPGIMV